jgi:hypothetical protein
MRRHSLRGAGQKLMRRRCLGGSVLSEMPLARQILARGTSIVQRGIFGALPECHCVMMGIPVARDESMTCVAFGNLPEPIVECI